MCTAVWTVFFAVLFTICASVSAGSTEDRILAGAAGVGGAAAKALYDVWENSGLKVDASKAVDAVKDFATCVFSGCKRKSSSPPPPDYSTPNNYNVWGGMRCDRDHAGPRETFLLMRFDKKIGFRAHTGWVMAMNGGGEGVFARAIQPLGHEQFRIVDNGDGRISFQTDDGHYLMCDHGQGHVDATATQPREWEMFTVEIKSQGVVHIKASNGKYVTAIP